MCMLKISTRIDDTEPERQTMMVECPYCGRKMVDVQYVSGVTLLRIKCTRCKHYVKINMTE
jgi:DNA-directed RNA polymerase subunit RPC12/RpoP